MQQHQYSVQRACSVSGVQRSVYYYTPRRDDTEVIDALQQHVAKHYTHGFPKTFAYLHKAGHPWNHKRVYRVYKELNLNLRRKGKRRLPARVKNPLHQPSAINQSWSIDFMQDRLINGRAFRTFNAIDDYNREVLAIEIDTSLTASRVIRTLEQVIAYRGKPQQIRMDNGPEFISHQFELWCREKQITLQYIQPGKPMQNGYIERFNGTYRRDILDAYLFEELWQVKQLTQEFVTEYNQRRPHQALNNLTPEEHLLKCGQLATAQSPAADLPTFQQIDNRNNDNHENKN